MLPLSEKELDEMVALERSRGTAPLNDWDVLSARLRAEGLITTPIPGRHFVATRWMQAAAAVVLIAGGVIAGRLSAGAPAVPAAVVQTAQEAAGEDFNPSGTVSPDAALASSRSASFQSPEEAWEVLNRAGDEYQRASAYLSASNTEVPLPTGPAMYRTRLAALDNVMSEMRDALKEAPQDPVINQYYLATVGAREATLRQLGTTLPAGARLNRF